MLVQSWKNASTSFPKFWPEDEEHRTSSHLLAEDLMATASLCFTFAVFMFLFLSSLLIYTGF